MMLISSRCANRHLATAALHKAYYILSCFLMPDFATLYSDFLVCQSRLLVWLFFFFKYGFEIPVTDWKVHKNSEFWVELQNLKRKILLYGLYIEISEESQT